MMRELLGRILGSQKFVYALVPGLANVVASAFGVDITQPAILALDAAFAALFLGQWILDLRWGSPSDGTGEFKKGAAAGLILVLAVGLSACSAKFPGPVELAIWPSASFEVSDTPFGGLCLGCREAVIPERCEIDCPPGTSDLARADDPDPNAPGPEPDPD